MIAAVLTEYGKPLTLATVPDPKCPPGGALIRVAAAGVCRTDPHVQHGRLRDLVPLEFPHVLGHEIAGHVEETGPWADGPAPGTLVTVYGAVHCGRCPQCRRGCQQLCGNGSWLGLGPGGGYAELVAVPHARQLIPLDGIDPAEGAVLTDAGATSYRAVQHVTDRLTPDSVLVVIGLGGLGRYAVQLARLLTPALIVCAVRDATAKAPLARELGAHEVVDLREQDAVASLREMCPHGAADAVIDLVTADNTISFARDVLAPGGIHVAAGLDNGTIPFGWDTVPLESVHLSTFWGSLHDLHDVLAMRRRGLIRSDVRTRPLTEINEVFDDLAHSRTPGARIAVVP
ncbi:alcohol dehydrogenase catalytic domain-containing protein [Streptomyces noursei]|uniref:alcohol dehydrogenase catalytic domain-containing protein n=1 Tax=Streptomyces noursei TaxID=1971 RepID=UPI0016732F1B|nr:alcohol dehydrogenase catalytic domain-containing protein [Streptomyces noursei]MCZ1021164.1 alcohol dehydrogenase catalytic domain-containing protein [Streptomyces noursei]GGX54076.1 oxidoreductase [Streptomyces noursei]